MRLLSGPRLALLSSPLVLLAPVSADPGGGADPHPDTGACPCQEPESGGPVERWSIDRLRSAAESIKADIEELRGLRFTGSVEVKLADRDRFLQYARERAEAMRGADRMRQDEHVSRLLGLIPGDMDLERVTMDVLTEQVGGFYDPQTDTFYVMSSLADELARVIIAHEFTHALDDQHHDLDGTATRLAQNSDALLAHNAVVEGSGMELMFQWVQENLDADELKRLLQAQSELPTAAVSSAPPVVWKPLVAIYYQGQAFLRRQARLRPQGGPARPSDIERAFRDPPRSTEQVLHPVKYWEDDLVDEPLGVACDSSGLPDGWSVLREDTFGELHSALLTTPFEDREGMNVSLLGLLGLRFTTDAAAGWGGDRYVLLAARDGLVFHMSSHWDTVKDAEEFAAVLGELRSEIEQSKARAPGHDDETSGFSIEVVDGDCVLVTSWTGLEESAVRRAVATLRFTTERE